MALCSTQSESVSGSSLTLKRALRRFHYVLGRVGVTREALGVTGHGLRHEELNAVYEDMSGMPSPVRGGSRPAPEVEREARRAVAELAGHSRQAAAGAYLGAILFKGVTPDVPGSKS